MQRSLSTVSFFQPRIHCTVESFLGVLRKLDKSKMECDLSYPAIISKLLDAFFETNEKTHMRILAIAANHESAKYNDLLRENLNKSDYKKLYKLMNPKNLADQEFLIGLNVHKDAWKNLCAVLMMALKEMRDKKLNRNITK